jgi:hypothetical protein
MAFRAVRRIKKDAQPHQKPNGRHEGTCIAAIVDEDRRLSDQGRVVFPANAQAQNSSRVQLGPGHAVFLEKILGQWDRLYGRRTVSWNLK